MTLWYGKAQWHHYPWMQSQLFCMQRKHLQWFCESTKAITMIPQIKKEIAMIPQFARVVTMILQAAKHMQCFCESWMQSQWSRKLQKCLQQFCNLQEQLRMIRQSVNASAMIRKFVESDCNGSHKQQKTISTFLWILRATVTMTLYGNVITIMLWSAKSYHNVSLSRNNDSNHNDAVHCKSICNQFPMTHENNCHDTTSLQEQSWLCHKLCKTIAKHITASHESNCNGTAGCTRCNCKMLREIKLAIATVTAIKDVKCNVTCRHNSSLTKTW